MFIDDWPLSVLLIINLAGRCASLLQCSQKWCSDSGWWTMSCSVMRACGDRLVLCAACRSQWLYRLMTKESRLWISFVGSYFQCGYLLEDTDQLKLATGCHSLQQVPAALALSCFKVQPCAAVWMELWVAWAGCSCVLSGGSEVPQHIHQLAGSAGCMCSTLSNLPSKYACMETSLHQQHTCKRDPLHLYQQQVPGLHSHQ